MLSNPPQVSGLHSRQRQHRRQNSTPSAFEGVKIAPLPNFQQQRQSVSHRRGLSLDTRRQQPPPPITTTLRQDYTTTPSTTTTNPGLSTTPQHVLRETQQQRIARPGHGQPNDSNNHFSDDFLMSPHGTAPLHPQFMDAMAAQGQMADLNGLSFDSYMGPMSAMMKKNQASFAASNPMNQPQEFDFFSPDSALSTPTFMTFPDASPAGSGQGWISEGETASRHSRRTSRRISNGILDKVAKFEAMVNSMDGSAQRPATPPGHNMNGYFPPTPLETPHDRMEKHDVTPQQRPNRFADDYDESMEETLKPIRGNRHSNRNSGIFQQLRQQAEAELVRTPPRANTMPMAFTEQGLRTPDFMNMTNLNDEFVKIEHGYDGLPTGRLSISSDMSSSMTSLGGPSHHHFDSQNTMMPHPSSDDSQLHMGSMSPNRHRRTDSIASIASAASIASINIEETKTDTGVTIDDIATYIEGPDPSDGKWVCLYEDCKKRFGRKENIKSHVQTHLNDRQYQCPTCKKCFVRQHDLKRHAKIHTGIKPYPCQCGNSFARHDALTRHRQRGMCIGAFEGITRKVVKRGRPRKNRPDLDERREKSERTKRKNSMKQHTSTSSMSSCQSGYSDSSAVNSPSNDFDNLMDDDVVHPFPDILDVAMGGSGDLTTPATTTSSTTMNPSNLTVSAAPMPTTLSSETFSMLSPSAGPGPTMTIQHAARPELIDLERAAASPSALSIHSQHHLTSSPVLSNYSALPNLRNNNKSTTTIPSSPGGKSVASSIYTQHNNNNNNPCTPPELSASSSPPPSYSSSTAQSSSTRFGGKKSTTHDDSATEEDEDEEQAEGNLSSISDASIGLGTTLSAHASAGGGSDNNDDLLLQFQDGLGVDEEYGLVGVGHQGMGMMSKSIYHHAHHGYSHQLQVAGGNVDVVVSEADYEDAAVNMSLFTDGDVFFGS
ncbi:metallothionein expression activator [Rhypophila decipiens]